MRNYLLTPEMIARELVGLARYYKLVNTLHYQIYLEHSTNKLHIDIDNYKDIIIDLNIADLRYSLDDFAELYLNPIIKDLLDKQNMYDDAGQVI